MSSIVDVTNLEPVKKLLEYVHSYERWITIDGCFLTGEFQVGLDELRDFEVGSFCLRITWQLRNNQAKTFFQFSPQTSSYQIYLPLFEVYEDDVWICCFPKSETTWSSELVWCLRNELDLEKANTVPNAVRTPFLEQMLIKPTLRSVS